MSQQGPRRYGLICETKTEGPLIWESAPMALEDAASKMHDFARSSNFIRVAVFEMKSTYFGNDTLIDGGEEK